MYYTKRLSPIFVRDHQRGNGVLLHYLKRSGSKLVRADDLWPAAHGLTCLQGEELLALAHQIDRMIRRGEIASLAEAARICGVTRARMTQITNLMLLAPDFALVADSGPVLGSFCAILPRDAEPRLPDWVLPRVVPWEDERCYMLLGQGKQDHGNLSGTISGLLRMWVSQYF